VLRASVAKSSVGVLDSDVQVVCKLIQVRRQLKEFKWGIPELVKTYVRN
jgi:hypothetical protein